MYVKCDTHSSAGLAFRSLHGCWFDGKVLQSLILEFSSVSFWCLYHRNQKDLLLIKLVLIERL